MSKWFVVVRQTVCINLWWAAMLSTLRATDKDDPLNFFCFSLVSELNRKI